MASEKALANYHTSKAASLVFMEEEHEDVDRALSQVLANRRAEQTNLASLIFSQVS